MRLTPVADVEQTVALVPRPGTDDLYAASRNGEVRRLVPGANGFTVDPQLVLDEDIDVTVTEEQGLLGIAFSPDGSKIVTSITDPADGFNSRLAIYDLVGTVADPGTRTVLMRVDQPYLNHNGGGVVWGPDGYLYWGLGDGGNGDPEEFDVGNRAQDLSDLLGKILRIDPLHPSAGRPYGIPADNPFATPEADERPEIWLRGVRNPWRFSFDQTTRDLWVADVGGSEREEIDLLTAASGGGRDADLGWSVREGTRPTGRAAPDGAQLIDPVHEYSHADGSGAVMGGYIYRGTAVPDLQGRYIFSDYAKPGLRALDLDGDRVVSHGGLRTEGDPPTLTIGFGQDLRGELYVLTWDRILRIDPPSA